MILRYGSYIFQLHIVATFHKVNKLYSKCKVKTSVCIEIAQSGKSDLVV